VFTIRKKERVYIYYSLFNYNIPDYNYLFLKELCLVKGQAINFRSSIIKSSSNKKIRVSAA